MTTNFATITTDVHQHIGVITIDREEKRNALSSSVLAEIGQVLTEWETTDQVAAVLFTGAGEKAFIAGADISQLASYDMAHGLRAEMQRLYDRIEDYAKPTMAAINGVAMGGGLELAMACDIRIAAEHTKLGLPETRLGVIPGAGGTQRLTRLVGPGRALDMIVTARIIDAATAERYGLLTQVVAADELQDTAYSLLAGVLEKGPMAIRLARMVVKQGAEADQKTGLMLETLAQSLLYTTQDKVEGAEAFLAKRPAEFQGR